jgi:hypothetical protein
MASAQRGRSRRTGKKSYELSAAHFGRPRLAEPTVPGCKLELQSRDAAIRAAALRMRVGPFWVEHGQPPAGDERRVYD